MYHCGLDGHQKTTQICVVDGDGNRVLEENLDTKSTDLEALLAPYVKEGLAVALEASSLSYHFFDRLEKIGVKAQVWPPSKLRVIAESRAKTDKNDARWMAELLRTGFHPRAVHVPCEAERSLRDALVVRQVMVRSRAREMQVARALASRNGVSVTRRKLSYATGWRELRDHAELPEDRKAHIQILEKSWSERTELIGESDKDLKERAKADRRAQLLMTIPGVGLLSSLWFLTTIGDPKRFKRSREVGAYFGVVPTTRESGGVRRDGHITKQGKPEIRWIWVQAAHAFTRSKAGRATTLFQWFEKTAKRRGKKIALVALSKKLLVIAWHVLREDREFRA
jgi:transposase